MKIEKIEITKDDLFSRAEKWFKTNEFTINQNGSAVTVRPISSCVIPLPVNLTAQAILSGFFNHLFHEAGQEATLRRIEEKMKKGEEPQNNL